MCGWPFANHLRLPSLVAAVRGDGLFCVSCSAGGAAVEVIDYFRFEFVVLDGEFCELVAPYDERTMIEIQNIVESFQQRHVIINFCFAIKQKKCR